MALKFIENVPDSVKGYLGLGIIITAAVLMGLAELRHIKKMSTTVGIVVFALGPFLLDVALIGAAVELWRSRFEGNEILRVTGWVVLGMLIMGTLAAWTITHQNIRGQAFAHAPFVLVNNLSAGGLIGFVVGWYDCQSRRYRQQAETERNRIEFLHNILSHNLLNGLSIIQGNAELLKDEVDEAARQRLARITSRSEELNRFARSTRTLMEDFLGNPSQDFERYDLSKILTTELEKASEDFEHAEFSSDQLNEVEVLADEFLAELFRNLLTNAVLHNDKETPRVALTSERSEESVIVQVRDNGPGIPEEERERVLEWNVKGTESSGTGLGLAIANTLTERYGGSLWIEDNEPTGTIVNVELPIETRMEEQEVKEPTQSAT